MKTATVKELKQELNYLSQTDLMELCLHLSRFKKENKELLTYLLFEASNEAGYIEGIKEEISQQFTEINTNSYYYIKKSVRKILRRVKTYIRYSKKKETEAELLIYFCKELLEIKPSIKHNTVLRNMFNMQIKLAEKAISNLHEDLQYDFNLMIEELF